MNLAAYDKVDNKIDKTKTWLDHNNKRIVSKQIKYRTYQIRIKTIIIHILIIQLIITKNNNQLTRHFSNTIYTNGIINK